MKIRITLLIEASREVYQALRADDYIDDKVVLGSRYEGGKIVYTVDADNPFIAKSILNDILRVVKPLLEVP